MSEQPDCDERASDTTPLAVKSGERKAEVDPGSCLRPLGLCELGGCCEICWYSPDHPRFHGSS